MPTLSAQLRAAGAIDEVLNGRSIRDASRDHDINRTYVSRRIRGIRTREEYYEARQKLSKHQEDHLAEWALAQASLGYAPPVYRFRDMALRLLRLNNDDAMLGKHWHERYLRRHPNLGSARARMMDYRRVNGASAENINLFFDRLATPELAGIPASHTYNADEVGIMEGIGDNGIVIGEPLRKFIVTKDAGNRTWTSIIECISAAGRALNPLIIFAGKNVQQQWFPDELGGRYDGWHFTTSPNGWTNNDIALRWLQTVFIPQTRPDNPDQWRALILDGHGSHTTPDFMWECFINKIYLVFLPAHTSHVLQPADLGPFSALKRGYRRKLPLVCMLRCTNHPGKQEFIMAFGLARKDRMTKLNIMAGWRATGIYPRDRSKALNNRLVRGARSEPKATTTPYFPPRQAPDFASSLSSIRLRTPSSSKDIRELARELTAVESAFCKPTARLLFKKLSKALDDTTLKIAAAEAHNDYLQTMLNKAKPTKRKKVIPDPNNVFVNIQDIMKEKGILKVEEMGGLDTAEDSDTELSDIDLESVSVAEECIVVLDD